MGTGQKKGSNVLLLCVVCWELTTRRRRRGRQPKWRWRWKNGSPVHSKQEWSKEKGKRRLNSSPPSAQKKLNPDCWSKPVTEPTIKGWLLTSPQKKILIIRLSPHRMEEQYPSPSPLTQSEPPHPTPPNALWMWVGSGRHEVASTQDLSFSPYLSLSRYSR